MSRSRAIYAILFEKPKVPTPMPCYMYVINRLLKIGLEHSKWQQPRTIHSFSNATGRVIVFRLAKAI